MDDVRTLPYEKGLLAYVVENCVRAIDILRRLNIELKQAFVLKGETDIKYIGDLHRIVQDYLIVKVASLFDKNSDTVSFAKWFGSDPNYLSILESEIIQYIIKTRHNNVAHNNAGNINQDFSPDTQKILDSDLPQQLALLKELLKL